MTMSKCWMAAFPNGSAKAAPSKAGPARPQAKFFTAIPKPALMRDFDAVMGIVEDKSAQMVDARSASRFTAEEKEPRAGVRGGHMPGAANVHYRAADHRRRHLESRPRNCAPPSHRPASISRAHRHHLRLRHHRRHPDAGAGRDRRAAMWRCMTAPGPNGAGGRSTGGRPADGESGSAPHPHDGDVPGNERQARPPCRRPSRAARSRCCAAKSRRPISTAISTTRSAATITGWTARS